MAAQSILSGHDSTGVDEIAPDDQVPMDTPSKGPQNQSSRNATVGHQLISSTTSERDWLLYLPPEVRLIVYRHALLEPSELPCHWLPMLLRDSGVQALPSLFFTSRLIRRESIEAFHRINRFYLYCWVPLTVIPSRRMSDMLQNLHVRISLSIQRQPARDRFVHVINTYGNPGIIRGTLYVQIMLFPGLHLRGIRHPSLRLYLRGLGRFTNFRVVEVEIYNRGTPDLGTSLYYNSVENALRFVLGPATPGALGNGNNGLTFFPQRFLNTKPLRKNLDWIDHLGELRLDRKGDESNSEQIADQDADKSGPSAKDTNTQS
ncbi:hypothetical protein MMC07_001933 [Pseudocyphellaria aurata]|nr:hypothetical protein [Pseudocyphellaria aurata]